MTFHRFLALSLMSAALSFFAPANANACRDCPFPMRISENQWLLQDSGIVLTIYNSEISGQRVLTKVILQDSLTNQVLASGSGVRMRYQRDFTLVLIDPSGHRLTGSIYFEDLNRPVFRARFTCIDQKCSLRR